ncbi:hypothetical protein TCE0_033r09150 [Talaromyces pinophilus]|uniref:Xylanolytic transcriptional activator regulatory domain-containing protein n=1 Tax=Talaromyces pinophilus TaxID=128442 RepID=A0A6V8HB73_TALPI|nr:hypothetical protein TCE0_033r09150 [Talaromyces pinophilus]
MLWCVVQTAGDRQFYLPGSRQRVAHWLYRLTISLLRERDTENWRRVHGGWELEDSYLDRDCSNRPRRIFSTGPTPTVDDVLAFVLLTVVISGGEFKSDCIKWWNKVVGLVKYLNFHKEPSVSDNTVVCFDTDQSITRKLTEKHEEQRRTFWLVYVLDRHLALSYNRSLHILDAECEVLSPLPEHIWQKLDIFPLESLPRRLYGPPTMITGAGLFEYLLPIMAILGDIIDFRFLRHHPRLKCDEEASLTAIKLALDRCDCSLSRFSESLKSLDDPPSTASSSSQTNRADLVVAYARYIIKVLYVLLYGNWDAISMLQDNGDWILTPAFSECASNSIAAAEAISNILTLDPELSFMSYLLGIYLFHGSFILLLFAERMPQIGFNPSVEHACEVIIRAHEVSIVTLSTDFQVSTYLFFHFPKALTNIFYFFRKPSGKR